MSRTIKLIVYLALTIASCVLGYQAYQSYDRLMTAALDASQNAPLDLVPALDTKSDATATEGYARVLTYGLGFFICVVVLGLLVGRDVSQLAGNRFLRTIYSDEDIPMKDPGYEQAEQEWADGHYLEAIRLMRDYLKKNPHEVHVSIRIAEIYEKDLQNNLAAALEYEEILKQKLPPERWGWSAIHLCNLYFKIAQPEKAVSLLHQIDRDYGETAAAEKARKRLALLESATAEQLAEEETMPIDQRPPSGNA